MNASPSDSAAALQRDGAVVIFDFLDDGDARSLEGVVERVYALLASCADIGDAELEQNYRSWNGVWVQALPRFLDGRDSRLSAELECIVDRIAGRVRELFGQDWRPYPECSFFRRLSGSKLFLPWHLDADKAGVGKAEAFNVWMPIEGVAGELPSLEIMRGSHLALRATPPRQRGEEVAAQFGEAWVPRLGLGDALVFDQYTFHRTQPVARDDIVRTSCEFRFYRD